MHSIMKLSQAIQGYEISVIADGLSPLTVAAYKSSLGLLIKFLKDPDIDQVGEKDLQAFFGYLRTSYHPERCDGETLSSASLHRYWKSIRSFWKWASSELEGIKRPDLSFKMPRYNHKEIMPYTEDEAQKLLKACEASSMVKPKNRKAYQYKRPSAARDRALILLLLDTGIRPGELTRLKIGDLDLSSCDLQVKPHYKGKTRPRILPIGKGTSKALWKYLVTRPEAKPNDPLFVTDENKRMTRYTVGSLVARLGKRAQIYDANPYRFRHTFAIQYLRNGGDVFTLQRLLGHASLQMVKHYLSLADTDSREAHRRASPVDNWRV